MYLLESNSHEIICKMLLYTLGVFAFPVTVDTNIWEFVSDSHAGIRSLFAKSKTKFSITTVMLIWKEL